MKAQAPTFQGCFELVLLVNLQASPISRVYQTCACGINKFAFQECVMLRLLRIQCGKKKCSKQALVVDTMPFVSSTFPVAGVMTTRAFPSRKCIVHALVVKHKLSYLVIVVQAGTCGEHTSFLSKEFQACAWGNAHAFSFRECLQDLRRDGQ